MMIKNIIIKGILVIPFFGFGQQFKNVKIDAPKAKSSIYGQVEPSICIHPKNKRKMIAGTVMNDYYYSRNGGKTWKSKTVSSNYGVAGDPVMHIDQKGRYYYFHLSNPINGHWLDRMVCQYSDKLKGNFNNGSFTAVNGNKQQDKQWVAENPITGELYLTWTEFDKYGSDKVEHKSRIMFSKSKDQGVTWSLPVCVSNTLGDCVDDDNTVEGAVPVCDKDGNIFVTWAYNNQLRFNYSKDNGETWAKQDKVITKQDKGWSFNVPGINRVNGLPILACNHKNGDLYVNWSDQSKGIDNTDVWLIKSTDKGVTWSKPIRVNQDNSGKHQFFNWITIDQSSGFIYCGFYDRRKHTDNTTDYFLAVSKDGAKTFQEYKINEVSFIPNEDVFFGDYTNISVVKGVVRPVWTSLENSETSLWTALISQKRLDRIKRK